jgi:hypothetical protein
MRTVLYIWALPTTAVGLVIVALTVLTRGRVKLHTGVIEASGGAARFILEKCTVLKGGASAMTLGHVVIARTEALHDLTRSHERIHVRQCERWGPLFLPAYLLASLYLWLRGRDAYRENPFEVQAYTAECRGSTGSDAA